MTTFKVEPETSTGGIGDIITVAVNVYNASDLWGWQVFMTWDPIVLNATNVVFGGFLAGQPEGSTTMSNIYNEGGFLFATETTFGNYPGVGNETYPVSGWLMSAEFEVLSWGETTLGIDNEYTYWMDSTLGTWGDEPGEMIKENGYFSNVAQPDFELTASPSSLTIQQGSSDTSTITVTSLNGFAEPVDLTVSGEPTGVTATLDPQQVTPPPDGSETSTLTVSVDVTAAPGNYILTVTGTSGSLIHSVDISLEITELPPPQPPVASFTYSPTEPMVDETVTFDASASYDPDGTIESYEWNFGDGGTGTGVVTTHTYNTAGTYTVTLTVTDDDGLTDTATSDVTVSPPELQPPVASFTFSPTSPLVDETVTFDASASYDPDGTIVSYDWDFGDGLSDTGEIVTHAYSAAGTYTVTLTVTDNDGLTDTITKDIVVSAPPATVIYVDPSTVSANPGGYFTINIDIADVTDLYSWQVKLRWTLGLLDIDAEDIVEGPFLKQGGITVFAKKVFTNYIDIGCSLLGTVPGVTGSGTLATATFKVLKTGNATLELYFTKLQNSSLQEIPHTSQDGYFYTTWPVADFSYSPNPLDNPGHPIQGETITFDASSSYDPDGGTIVSYEWDFGDGTSDTGQIVTHAYDAAGSYFVTLTVTDDEGETYDVSQSIIVLLHDISVIEVVVDPTKVVAGDPVTINATVLNKGSVSETFNVTVYYDDTPIDTKTYWNLVPTENATLSFTWSTEVALGEYVIKAYAYIVDSATLEPRPDLETNLEDNTLIDGTVDVTVHDVAVVDVTVSKTEVAQGEPVTITVTVENQGGFTETFDVIVYYDGTQAAPPQTVTDLEGGASESLSLVWDTSGIAENTYTIKAEASVVEREEDTADNTFTDGTVTITSLVALSATVDFKPETLNLESKGSWITAYIELPEGYDVSDIDRTTLLLNGTLPVDPFWIDKPLESVVGDYDNDGVTDLMVKFDRQALIEYLKAQGITEAEVTLTITGEAGGIQLEGSDTIQVISKGATGSKKSKPLSATNDLLQIKDIS
jgi:PKD repeat protein